MSNAVVDDDLERAEDRARPPGARQLLPLLLIAPAVAAPIWWIDRTPVVGFWTAMIAASAAAGVLGIPVLYWALDHGRATARWLVPLGAFAATLFPIVLLAGGTLNLARLGGRRHFWRLMRRGAPVPVAGQIAWPQFVELALTAVVIGALTGLVYALLRPGQPRRTSGA